MLTTPRNLSPQKTTRSANSYSLFPFDIQASSSGCCHNLNIVPYIHTVQCYIHSVIDSPTLSLAVSWTSDVSRAACSLRAGDSVHGQSYLCVRTTNNNSSQSTNSTSGPRANAVPTLARGPPVRVTAVDQSQANADTVPWLAQYPTALTIALRLVL